MHSSVGIEIIEYERARRAKGHVIQDLLGVGV